MTMRSVCSISDVLSAFRNIQPPRPVSWRAVSAGDVGRPDPQLRCRLEREGGQHHAGDDDQPGLEPHDLGQPEAEREQHGDADELAEQRHHPDLRAAVLALAGAEHGVEDVPGHLHRHADDAQDEGHAGLGGELRWNRERAAAATAPPAGPAARCCPARPPARARWTRCGQRVVVAGGDVRGGELRHRRRQAELQQAHVAAHRADEQPDAGGRFAHLGHGRPGTAAGSPPG